MAVMTYDQWFAANGNKGNWGGYQQYVMNQTGATRQQAAGGAEGAGWSGSGSPDQTGMRAQAKERGFSEDFDRFDERTLNQWEQYKDQRCPPHAPYAAINGTGCVEKPIDTNYNPQNAQYLGVQAGEKGFWYGPNGEKRAFSGGGGGGQPTGQDAGINGNFQPMNPLQQKLMEMVGGQQGFFGENPFNNAASLQGGGVWWGQGADFSQAFNPLAPQGAAGKPKAPAAAQNANPFQQTAQQVQGSLQSGQAQANPLSANIPQYKQDMLSQISRNRSPMVGKLSQIYRGGI